MNRECRTSLDFLRVSQLVISDFAQIMLFECFLASFNLRNLFSQISESKAEKIIVTKRVTSGNEQSVQNKFQLSPI